MDPNRKRKKGSECPPFIFINGKTLWSEKWRQLLPSRQVIYLYLKSRYNGQNNGDIYFPYVDFEYQFNKKTFYSSLTDLETRGWIRRKKKGSEWRFHYLYELTGEYDELNKPRKPFAALDKNLLNLQVWKELSHPAKIHYVLIKCSTTGPDKEKYVLPYSKLKGMFSPATSAKARKELIAQGWLEKVVEGGGLFGKPTCYRIKGRYDWWPNKTPYGW